VSFAFPLEIDLRVKLRSLTLDRQKRVLTLINRGHTPGCGFVMGSQFSGVCRCRLDQGHRANPAKKTKRKAAERARRVNR
jgi:hypothetical protein